MKNTPALYVVEHPDGLVKIGVSKTPFERLSRIQVGCPYKLSLRLVARTDYATPIERKMHSRFSDMHVRGEWFEDPGEEINEMIEDAKEVEKYLVSEVTVYDDDGNVDEEWSRYL